MMTGTETEIKTQGHKQSILIVGADHSRLKTLGNFFKEAGFEVLLATNKGQTEKITIAKRPCLVFIMNLPDGESSAQLCRQLKSLDENRGMPVLLAVNTAYPNEEIEAEEAGADDYMDHRFTARELLRLIVRQLKMAQLTNRHRKMESLLQAEVNPSFEKLVSLFETLFVEKKIGLSVFDALVPLQDAVQKLSETLTLPEYGFDEKRLRRPPQTIGRKLKILVVEDNHLNQVFLESVLMNEGHQVIIADTGEKAISGLKQHAPDLVFLDVSLPDMSGFEVHAGLSAQGNKAPVIVISGYSQPEIAEMYPTFEYDAFLQKPLNAADLLSQVSSYGAASVSPTNHDGINYQYDFSLALSISKKSGAGFRQWLEEFLHLLEGCITQSQVIAEERYNKTNAKLLHNLLNYTVYFGADKLKGLIWQFKNPVTILTHEEKELQYDAIVKECESLRNFYRDIDCD